MWQPLFGADEADAVPIDHVTNGVHLPTWLGDEMQELLRRHLGPEWQGQIHYPSAVEKLAEVPVEELWQAAIEAIHRPHAGCPPRTWTTRSGASSIVVRIAPNERWRRDLAVPSGMPRLPAISGRGIPRK